MCALLFFLLFFDISVGPVGWVVCSEIMTLNGFFIANVVSWACLGAVIAAFPFMIEPYALGINGSFYSLAGVALIAFFFVLFFVPETKGMNKTEIMNMLMNKSDDYIPSRKTPKFPDSMESMESYDVKAKSPG